jgi:hypothetical protein
MIFHISQSENTKKQIENIKKFIEKKNQKRSELGNSKGKLLIEKQIIEENKRKIEENFDIFKDQIREMEENVDNKEEYIKIFEKKLREVEIYVQKNTKMLFNSKYDCYKNFIMNDFINENTTLLKKKEISQNENKELLKILEEAKMDNKNLKKLNKDNNFNSDDSNSENYIDDVKGEIVIVNTESENMSKVISKKINSSRIIDNEIDNIKFVKNEIIQTLPNDLSMKPTIFNFNNNNIYLKPNANQIKEAKKAQIEKIKQNKKLKEILKHYNNHIKLIENKNKLIKSQIKELHSRFINSIIFFLTFKY